MAVYKVFLILAMSMVVSAIDSNWYEANATSTGDMKGGDPLGACGYGDIVKHGYGLATAALSMVLFNDGLSCGACFEIYCSNGSKWCIPKAGSIIITATGFCHPNYTETEDVWCNPPQKHFNLSMPMFTKIAYDKAGVITVRYRRVLCSKQGGVKFEMSGSPHFTIALIYNVGGAGDVSAVKIKGSDNQWMAMTRSGGQNWLIGTLLIGQSLSFQVTVSDGNTIEFDNVVPADWLLGQTYEGRKNF